MAPPADSPADPPHTTDDELKQKARAMEPAAYQVVTEQPKLRILETQAVLQSRKRHGTEQQQQAQAGFKT